MGASKTLRTARSKTSFDISNRNELDSEILELLKISQSITDTAQEIFKMEAALHDVILSRVEDIVTSSLPQLTSYLYEKGEFYFPVPGMYGGFTVKPHPDRLEVYSEVRIMRGSEMTHLIRRNGDVTLK